MAQIDTLTLEVNADISKASQKLETLARRLDYLKESTGKAVGAYKNLARELAKITVPSKNLNNILKVSNALTSLNSVNGKNIETLASGFNDLTNSLQKMSQFKRVSTQLDKINKIASSLNGLNSVKGNNIIKSADGLTNLASSIESMPESVISKIERLGSALQTIPDNTAIRSLGRMKTTSVIGMTPQESGTTTQTGASGVGDILTDTKNKIAEAKNFSQVIGTLTTSLKALKALPWVGVVTTGLGLLGKAFKKLISPITSVVKALKGFIKSLARIAFYRFIRSILKEISQGLKEGINNLALYSKALEGLDAHNANNVLSRYASSFLYLKNTIATAVIPALRALIPIFEEVIQKAVNFIDIIAQLGSAIFGTDYTKAKYYWVDYADSLDKASGSAKALHHQLAGFDELNNLTAPSAGGRGKNELDPTEMFAEATISQKILDIIGKVKGLWSDIKEIMSPVVEKAKELWGTLKLTWEKLYPNLVRIWNVVKKTWTQVVKPFLKGFTEGLMKGLFGDEQKNLPEVVGSLSEKLADLAEGFGKLIDKVDPDKVEKFGETLGKVLGVILKITNPLRSLDGYVLAFSTSLDQTVKFIKSLKENMEDAQSPLDLFKVAFENIKDLAGKLWDKLGEGIDKLLGLDSTFTNIQSPMDLVKTAFANITTEADSLKDKFIEAIDKTGTLKENFDNIKSPMDLVETAFTNIVNGAKSLIDKFTETSDKSDDVEGKFETLKTRVDDLISVFGVGGLVDKIANAKDEIDNLRSKTSDTNSIFETFKTKIDDAKSAVEKVKTEVSNLKHRFEEIKAYFAFTNPFSKMKENTGNTLSLVNALKNALDNLKKIGKITIELAFSVTGLGVLGTVADAIGHSGGSNDNPIQKITDALTNNNDTKTTSTTSNNDLEKALKNIRQTGHTKTKALGGYVPRGDLFIANETSPEMIGSIGGNTAVANNNQITEAIAQATYTAMSKALAENGGSVNIVVEGDGEQMFKVFQKKQREYTRQTGYAY